MVLIAHAHTSCHRALAGTAGQRGGGEEAVVGGSTQGPSVARRRGCDVDVRLLAQRRHAARRWLCLRTAHHRCPPETCAALAGDGCLVTLAPQESPPPSSLFARINDVYIAVGSAAGSRRHQICPRKATDVVVDATVGRATPDLEGGEGAITDKNKEAGREGRLLKANRERGRDGRRRCLRRIPPSLGYAGETGGRGERRGGEATPLVPCRRDGRKRGEKGKGSNAAGGEGEGRDKRLKSIECRAGLHHWTVALGLHAGRRSNINVEVRGGVCGC
ncbi:Os07g0648600 [Oryza sativa Japonica Group]|uniref:Os07g0648600 protein n=2 Tax=Oryza sativa subsp. japonica TaxID=39947 RepID=C7J5B3_ORYSJ|nr:Os07g0648600 [Oryza sativa Japonica Group]|eukprot:NP_001175315.1 Os07g0648600 [Oryza sativa Japonica Group]